MAKMVVFPQFEASEMSEGHVESTSISCVVFVRVHSQVNSTSCTPPPPLAFTFHPLAGTEVTLRLGQISWGWGGSLSEAAVTSHVKFPSGCFTNIYAENAEN